MGTNKDWTGGKASTYFTIGAQGHGKEEREKHDYYATSPLAAKYLLEFETFNHNIWEPACGENHITNVLREHGYNVRTSDIIDRIGDGTVEIIDFLTLPTGDDYKKINTDIITNPPYKYAKEFVEKSMELIADGCKVAMYLKITFLEGKGRKEMFKKYPPKYVYVSSSRLGCAKNGELLEDGSWPGGAACFAWYIWEKGFTGEPVIRWFN